MTLAQRVTALEQIIIQLTVSQTNNRLDHLAQSAIEADKRLTRLENLAERAENRLDRLEKVVADNSAAIDRLEKTVADNSKAIDRLEKVVADNSIAISRLEQVTANLGQKVNDLGQRVGSLEQVTTNLGQKVDNLGQRVGSLEQVTTNLGQKVDNLEQKFDKLEQKVDDGFKQLANQISSLGFRWGVHNESIWRQTIASVLEKSYGVTVKRLDLGTDEIDVLISNGNHIIIEITSRFHPRDVTKVIRKRQLYTDQIQAPSRFIIAAASIHSKVTQQLTDLGFEVIEPDDE